MENLPPGFRFHPSDEELIAYYLTRKVADSAFVARAINVVDLNRCEPWDLPGKASMGERDWYFFSPRDRKYPTGLRTNRATEAGYWKTTGKDKEISSSGVLVGSKKTLVFYKGRAPKGEKTNWVMHEYRLSSKFPSELPKQEWVVCRVFQKRQDGRKAAPPPLQRSPSNATSLIVDPRKKEFSENDYCEESNSDLSEISRKIGSSAASHFDRNSHDNISNMTTATTTDIAYDNHFNVDTRLAFARESAVQNSPSSLMNNGFFNLNIPSLSSSNMLGTVQMNILSNYQQQPGATNVHFNSFIPSDSSIALQAPASFESFWQSHRSSC